MSSIDALGPALEMAAHIHIQTARRTGRTTAMLDAVKPGSRIIAPTQEAARFIEREVRERQLEDVKVHSIPASFDALGAHGHHYKPGAMVFDHTWFETFYLAGLKRMRSELGGYMHGLHRQRTAVDAALIHPDYRFEGPWL